jgi:hypothetical protein
MLHNIQTLVVRQNYMEFFLQFCESARAKVLQNISVCD